MSTPSADAKGIDARYAAFEGKRTALQEVADSLEAEEKKLKEEELRLEVAKKTLSAKRSKIEAEKTTEERT